MCNEKGPRVDGDGDALCKALAANIIALMCHDYTENPPMPHCSVCCRIWRALLGTPVESQTEVVRDPLEVHLNPVSAKMLL